MVAADSQTVLPGLNVRPRKYLLNVARFVPEKRQLDLIRAFSRIERTDWKLVLVGSAQHESDYAAMVRTEAQRTPNCILAGARTGAELATLYANAGVFVLPSAHEGLPVTLLEALSFGLTCAASDIPANRELGLPDERYFPVGDVVAQSNCLSACMSGQDKMAVSGAAVQSIERLPEDYQWGAVAAQTILLMRQACTSTATSTRRQKSADLPGVPASSHERQKVVPNDPAPGISSPNPPSAGNGAADKHAERPHVDHMAG